MKCIYSAGNMGSHSAGSWLSSMRLYMIIRASAGYGWVNSFVSPLFPVIIKQASFGMLSWDPCHYHFSLSVRSVWHQTQCTNHLCTPTLVGKRKRERQWSLVTSSYLFLIVWQKMEAAYYDNIIEQQRIEPEFFRMGFYGRKFPFFLRVRLTQSVSVRPPQHQTAQRKNITISWTT